MQYKKLRSIYEGEEGGPDSTRAKEMRVETHFRKCVNQDKKVSTHDPMEGFSKIIISADR